MKLTCRREEVLQTCGGAFKGAKNRTLGVVRKRGDKVLLLWADWVKILKSWQKEIEILIFVLGGRGTWKVKENIDQDNETYGF